MPILSWFLSFQLHFLSHAGKVRPATIRATGPGHRAQSESRAFLSLVTLYIRLEPCKKGIF
jgi:hypothetical protein